LCCLRDCAVQLLLRCFAAALLRCFAAALLCCFAAGAYTPAAMQPCTAAA